MKEIAPHGYALFEQYTSPTGPPPCRAAIFSSAVTSGFQTGALASRSAFSRVHPADDQYAAPVRARAGVDAQREDGPVLIRSIRQLDAGADVREEQRQDVHRRVQLRDRAIHQVFLDPFFVARLTFRSSFSSRRWKDWSDSINAGSRGCTA